LMFALRARAASTDRRPRAPRAWCRNSCPSRNTPVREFAQVSLSKRFHQDLVHRFSSPAGASPICGQFPPRAFLNDANMSVMSCNPAIKQPLRFPRGRWRSYLPVRRGAHRIAVLSCGYREVARYLVMLFSDLTCRFSLRRMQQATCLRANARS
jgi:hypothetical protein